MSLAITLPYPPSANRLWRTYRGRTVRSAEYQSWRNAAGLIVQAAARGCGLDGPYIMALEVGRPDRRRRDLDNLIKPVGDALVLGGAVRDDADCHRIEAEWVPGIAGVRVSLSSIFTGRAAATSSPSATGVPD